MSLRFINPARAVISLLKGLSDCNGCTRGFPVLREVVHLLVELVCSHLVLLELSSDEAGKLAHVDRSVLNITVLHRFRLIHILDDDPDVLRLLECQR